MGITTIFLLLGGLGLFLFGMKLMSDGLEQVAGARMRSVLNFYLSQVVGMLAWHSLRRWCSVQRSRHSWSSAAGIRD